MNSDEIKELAEAIDRAVETGTTGLATTVLDQGGSRLADLVRTAYDRYSSGAAKNVITGRARGSIGSRVDNAGGRPVLTVGAINNPPDYIVFNGGPGPYITGSAPDPNFGNRGWQGPGGRAQDMKLKAHRLKRWFEVQKGHEVDADAAVQASKLKAARRKVKKLGLTRESFKKLGVTRADIEEDLFYLSPETAKRQAIGAIVRKIILQGTKPHPFMDDAMAAPQWQRIVQDMARDIATETVRDIVSSFRATRSRASGISALPGATDVGRLSGTIGKVASSFNGGLTTFATPLRATAPGGSRQALTATLSGGATGQILIFGTTKPKKKTKKKPTKKK